MKTSIVISLDTRRSKKDGSFPLVMRIVHHRETISIPLGFSIKSKDWDDKTRAVKKSYDGIDQVARLNNMIQKQKTEAMTVIMKLHEKGQLDNLSASELKDLIYRPAKAQSFVHFGTQLSKELTAANRFGTARAYKDAVTILKVFSGHEDIPFARINYQFLRRFEAFHLGKGNSLNGLASYLRSIRAIFNKAIKSGIVEKELYPFDAYKIKTEPTEKRALDWEFLKKLIELQLEPGHILFNARNYFVASYMMYGMNFKDMAYLKPSDIQNGRINYRRKKTAKLYDIKVTKNLEAILSYYLKKSSDTGYIFPILRRESLAGQHKDVLWARKRYNKKLDLLAKECGIDKKITSYVSRHSFATQAMLQEVPINAISAMLGHSSLKTTEIYLKSLPSNVLDDYNTRILER